jgi:hypothetical protein
MGRWTQPSISALNATQKGDQRRDAKVPEEKRCLFAALNEAAWTDSGPVRDPWEREDSNAPAEAD